MHDPIEYDHVARFHMGWNMQPAPKSLRPSDAEALIGEVATIARRRLSLNTGRREKPEYRRVSGC